MLVPECMAITCGVYAIDGRVRVGVEVPLRGRQVAHIMILAGHNEDAKLPGHSAQHQAASCEAYRCMLRLETVTCMRGDSSALHGRRADALKLQPHVCRSQPVEIACGSADAVLHVSARRVLCGLYLSNEGATQGCTRQCRAQNNGEETAAYGFAKAPCRPSSGWRPQLHASTTLT